MKIVFSPYGAMNQDESENVGLKVPNDWSSPTLSATATREEQWSAWLKVLILDINRVLWPTWNPQQRRWTPAESVDRMEALTNADFQVFQLMQEANSGRGLDTIPNSPNRAEGIYNQRQFFIIEDNRTVDNEDKVKPFASYYNLYDAKLPKETAAFVSDLFFDSIRHKVRNTPYQVKALLQRPRPYQTAPLFGWNDFVNEFALTGQTPSACSGHCLQGLIGVGGIFECLESGAGKLDLKNQESMKQYAADVGDRRVMAGVHYPSDNLCSWILVMALADRVYRDPTIKQWLWQAISERSLVFRFVRDFSKTKSGDVYKPALAYLRKLAR